MARALTNRAAQKPPDPTWESTDEVVEVAIKKPLEKVIPIRLSAENWQALHEEARELGVGPTTLARMWILAQLKQIRQTQPVPPAAKKTIQRQR